MSSILFKNSSLQIYSIVSINSQKAGGHLSLNKFTHDTE